MSRKTGMWQGYSRLLLLWILMLGGMLPSFSQVTDTQIFKQRTQDDESDPKALPPEIMEEKDKVKQISDPSSLAPLELTFVKEGEEIPPGVMFFNVLKVTNPSEQARQYSLSFEKPDFANLILQESSQGIITVEAGQKSFIPIRVSFPSETEGGVPYKVVATVNYEDSDQVAQTETEVVFQRVSKWRASTPMSKKYVARGDPHPVEIPLRVRNRGNCMEELFFDFELGKQLVCEEESKKEFRWKYYIRPSLDTTILVPVRVKPNKSAFINPIDFTFQVEIGSETDTVPQLLTVVIEEVAQDFENLVDLSQAPLIIGLTHQGIQEASTDLSVGGTRLMVDDKELTYQVNLKDIQANSQFNDREFSLRNVTGNVQYKTPRSFLKAGNIGGGSGVNVNGFGLSLGHHFGLLEPGKGVDTRLIAGYNPMSKEFGASGSARWKTKDELSLEMGTGVKRNFQEQSTLVGLQSSAHYTFGQTHSVGLNFGSTYKTGPDTMAGPRGLGAAYAFQYSGNIKEKLTVGFENEFISENYANANGGVFNYKAEAGYEFSSNSKLGSSFTSRSSQIIRQEKDGSRSKLGKNQTTSFRTAYNTRWKQIGIGLGMERASQKTIMKDPTLGKESSSLRFNVGLGTTWRKKNDNTVSLSPTVTFGYQQRNIQLGTGEQFGGGDFSTQVGLRGRYKSLSLNAKYTHAPGQEAMNSPSAETKNNQRAEMTAGYERAFLGERLVYQANVDVRYDISEKVLESLLSTSLDYQMKNGWSIGVDVKWDPGKFAAGHKVESFNIGGNAAKAFDFSQPRLKFYDLKIEFYKDENGNLVRDENEEGIGHILVKLERAKDPENLVINGVKIMFTPPETLSNENGQVDYKKIPQGQYLIELKELAVIQDFANLAGKDFEIFMNDKATVSIPYSKSVTIEGKTHIERDKFSRLHGISPAKIRVTIQDANGKLYHTLTSSNGSYSVTLPYSEHYSVSMKNVLGSKFDLLNPESEVAPEEGTSRYHVDFNYKEKGRGINFGS